MRKRSCHLLPVSWAGTLEVRGSSQDILSWKLLPQSGGFHKYSEDIHLHPRTMQGGAGMALPSRAPGAEPRTEATYLQNHEGPGPEKDSLPLPLLELTQVHGVKGPSWPTLEEKTS